MELRLAVIGYGHWGPNLVNSVNAAAHCTTRIICELSEQNLAAAAERHPHVKLTRSVDDVFADDEIDAVLIASPSATHYDLAKRSLEAGKHTFVEKPMTLRSSEGEDLVRIAAHTGCTLMAGYVFLYNSAVRYIKDLIDRGELGDLFYVDTNRTNLGPLRTDVSAIWDLAPHDISVINYWFDASPVRVYASQLSYLASTSGDCGFLHLEYPGNRHGHSWVSWLNPRKDRLVTIVGRKRMLTWDDVDVSEPIRIYEKGISETIHRGSPAAGAGRADQMLDFKTRVFDGNIVIPKIPGSSPLQQEMSHFAECIREKKTPLTDGVLGTSVTKTLEAAEESMRLGQSVSIQD